MAELGPSRQQPDVELPNGERLVDRESVPIDIAGSIQASRYPPCRHVEGECDDLVVVGLGVGRSERDLGCAQHIRLRLVRGVGDGQQVVAGRQHEVGDGEPSSVIGGHRYQRRPIASGQRDLGIHAQPGDEV